MTDNKYDVVIIGAGIGGLVSAARLSNSGEKVLVIEKEPRAGGYLTEFYRNGYVFDASLHLLNGCTQGQYVYDVFEKCGIIDSIDFLKPRYLYRSVFPDFDVRIPQTDMLGCGGALSELFPDSAEGIKSLITEMSEIHSIIKTSVLLKKPSAKLFCYLRQNADKVIDAHIKDPKLKALICQLWVYFGLPPSLLRSIDFCYPWFDYHKYGGYYLSNGSYKIVKALKARIESNGGHFVFNKNATKIQMKDFLCEKVFFGTDNDVRCTSVISNIDLKKTVFELIGEKSFSSQTIENIKNIKPSISAFEIFLGLDADLSKPYPDDYEIFVNSGYDLNTQYHQCIKNDEANAPFLITINSNVNTFSAPKGKSTVSIIMLAGYDYWSSMTKNEYEDAKQKKADVLIKRASMIIPEIKNKIAVKSISTPMTFERYTNNACGAIYGYRQSADSIYETRTSGLGGIKNLYFASAWARQGSGVAKVLCSAEDAVERRLRHVQVAQI